MRERLYDGLGERGITAEQKSLAGYSALPDLNQASVSSGFAWYCSTDGCDSVGGIYNPRGVASVCFGAAVRKMILSGWAPQQPDRPQATEWICPSCLADMAATWEREVARDGGPRC